MFLSTVSDWYTRDGQYVGWLNVVCWCLGVVVPQHGVGGHAVASRVRFLMVSLEFFIDIILPAALWPWG